MKKTNKKTFYTMFVLVVIAIVVLGWYAFSAQAAASWSGSKCPRWRCTDVKTYTCPEGTANSTCSDNSLTCYICSTSYNTKDYNVTLTAIGNQNVYTNYNIRLMGVAYQNISNVTLLSGIFTVNNETFQLRAGQTYMLSDQTIFGVTTLYLNYSTFYLKSTYETKSSSLVPGDATMISLWTSIPNAAVFTVNNETFLLREGQTKMFLDQTIFGVTTLYLNYSIFYLQSAYETKSSSLTAPFPKSTIITLIVSETQGCGAGRISCPNDYIPSCSGDALICTATTTNFFCSYNKPFENCKSAGSCRNCLPV